MSKGEKCEWENKESFCRDDLRGRYEKDCMGVGWGFEAGNGSFMVK